MPDPHRLLATLNRAIEAFRNTPGRRGRVVYLEDAAEVLVAGDLHGNLENLRQLLVVAQLTANPRRHLVLQEIIHGPMTYPEGGDKSHQLVDLLAALKCQHPRQVHMLVGNHELAQATGRPIGKGDKELNDWFFQGVTTAYGFRTHEIYEAYLQLFTVAPLALRTRNRVFLSHSLPSSRRLAKFDPAALECDYHPPEELRVGGVVHSLVWGRDVSPENVAEFLRKVDADLLITGHIPCANGFEAPNDQQIILDCLGTPGGYCLFPADRPLTHAELLGCVSTF